MLKQARLGGSRPWDDGTFAAVFSTGVFTEGHAPASSFDDLVRITRRGGYIIVTVRDIVFERDGFAQKFSDLETSGRWISVETSEPFRAFAIAEPDVLVRAYVFQVRSPRFPPASLLRVVRTSQATAEAHADKLTPS
jgi:hypothetical protein